jgi:glycosidase
MSDWIRGAVIYHILIDRFAGYTHPEKATEPVFIGGNIRGIIDKLPYFESLGVSVLWLSPFYKGVAYHGYHTTDLYSIDPRFGSEKDLKELLRLAHKRSLKVICDFVPNHVSHLHPLFLEAQKNSDSQYADWFTFDKWPTQYRTFLSFKELPKLNLDNMSAMEQIRGAAHKWLALGFDGYRLDHIIGLSNQNVRDLVEPLRQEFPDAVFIGEAWLHGVTFRDLATIRVPHVHWLWLLYKLGLKSFVNDALYRNYTDLLDGVLNFEGARLLEKYVTTDSADTKQKVKSKLLKQSRRYRGKLALVSFLDNHDMERFLFRCGGDVQRLKDAAKLQFSLDQPAAIYYGTEVGLTQNQPFTSRQHYADLLARHPMEWSRAEQNSELPAYYRELTNR